MEEMNNIQVELQQYTGNDFSLKYDFDRIVYDLDSDIDLLSSKADKLDYLVSIGSGVLCGLLDILWVGDFSLERGRDIASKGIDKFVVKTARLLGYKGDSLQSAVRFLENKFPIPSDGNTPDFGGGLQHHLRDFTHHPTIVGLVFSLLTQFTGKAYGTNVKGSFLTVDIPEISKSYIGKDLPSKIIYGTITWFFHLVSDMAGSSATVGKGGGTGIPGPILGFAKELSALPIFKGIRIGDNSLSIFLSKLFNGTLFARRDDAGKLIKDTVVKFDLRGEFGLGIELGRQSLPVIANECIIRSFYFMRKFALVVKNENINSASDLKHIEWDKVKPVNGPTLNRMLVIGTGVFTSIDVADAVISKKYWLAVNLPGAGRFLVAIGTDVASGLKTRNIKAIRQMYEEIDRNVFRQADKNFYERIGTDMSIDKFGLNIEQIKILYNLQYYKTLNDIQSTKAPLNNEYIKTLKQVWLDEWKDYISKGFSSFLQVEGVELHWYTEQELIQKVEENCPQNTWFRLVLLETMLFEPYYPLSLEKDKKGNVTPSKKFRKLKGVINGYKRAMGDNYIDSFFSGDYYSRGYVKRLRKCYDKSLRELNEVLKTAISSLSVAAIITVVTIATAGAFAPAIAVSLVGSKFAGLSGAALTSACLAYLGGGAIAAGGLGMAGGTMAIAGGGAILGLGVGTGVGGAVGYAGLHGKQNTILQSAKLLVSVKEIFLNDEHDTVYSNSIYEKYVKSIIEIEKGLIELRLQADEANGKKKREIKNRIKKAEESVKAMKIARKSLQRFISSFEEGLDYA